MGGGQWWDIPLYHTGGFFIFVCRFLSTLAAKWFSGSYSRASLVGRWTVVVLGFFCAMRCNVLLLVQFFSGCQIYGLCLRALLVMELHSDQSVETQGDLPNALAMMSRNGSQKQNTESGMGRKPDRFRNVSMVLLF